MDGSKLRIERIGQVWKRYIDRGKSGPREKEDSVDRKSRKFGTVTPGRWKPDDALWSRRYLCTRILLPCLIFFVFIKTHFRTFQIALTVWERK